jgi:hypothetical protein
MPRKRQVPVLSPGQKIPERRLTEWRCVSKWPAVVALIPASLYFCPDVGCNRGHGVCRVSFSSVVGGGWAAFSAAAVGSPA